MPRPKLSKLELQILEALWTHGKASIREIQEAFPEPRPAYTTIQTTVYRLEGKNALRRVRKIGNADIFEPLVARDVTRHKLLDEILSFFGGKAQPMMAQLAEAGKLTLDDVRELRKRLKNWTRNRREALRNDSRIDQSSVAIDCVCGRDSAARDRFPQESRAGSLLAVAHRVAQIFHPVCAIDRPWQSSRMDLSGAEDRHAGRFVRRGICRQPFPEVSVSTFTPAKTPRDWTPAILAVWIAGLLVIALIRLRLWMRVRSAVRASAVLEIADISAPVEIRSAPGLLEPGVVGLRRPILLLPEGIVERLSPSELEAVLAHELCHVRRRDNLFATIHMIAEAVFWFHPLVWWIGARLLEERERACDENVLSLGNQPRVYADAILNVCKLYAESPLVCVSGVTGSDIKSRIEAIMTNRSTRD